MKKLARKDGMIAKMMKTASAKSVFNSEVLGDSEWRESTKGGTGY